MKNRTLRIRGKNEEIFDSTWSAPPESPTKYAEPETPIVNSIGASSFDFIERAESFHGKLKGIKLLEIYKAFKLKCAEGKVTNFQDVRHNINLYKEIFEFKIIEKIKAKINLYKEEKIAANLVFMSLKYFGDFGNERIGEINEISINYLNKYFAFAHENVVAMRFTEAILYSLCSLKCRSLFIPENYFLKYFNKKYSTEIQLGAVVANSFVEKGFFTKSGMDVTLFILGIWNEAKSDVPFLGFSEKEISNCLYRKVTRLAKLITKCHGKPLNFHGHHWRHFYVSFINF